ncbi:MAG: hypothetical protein IJZ35_04960 [Clostridia bacterium]|nr:hypothetical protein [Clostridia bacterium]
MSEYCMSHNGAQLDEAISKVKNGYVLPSGEVEITESGTFDVTEYAQAKVNIAGLSLYKSGTLILSEDISGSQASYDESQLTIDVGFVPKLFILRQYNYAASTVTGAVDTSVNTVISSVNYFDDFCSGGNGKSFTNYISSNSYGRFSVVSMFKIADNSMNEVYYYSEDSTMVIRAGNWSWEAYA